MTRVAMAGLQYGTLTAICDVGSVSSGDRKWRFRCDCSEVFECSGYAVRSGKVFTCPACSAKRTRAASLTHGMSETPEFSVWTDIQSRCHNPNATSFPDYGGRGIVVCERWRQSFESFLSDMGARPSGRHSIERSNVNGNYEPGNCRWATAKEQGRNKRNNRLITIDGRTQTMSAWAEECGLNDSTILLRIKAGRSGAALIAPSKMEGCVEFNGVKDTYGGWAKRTGLKPSTIAMRLTKYRWPVAKALTQGASL